MPRPARSRADFLALNPDPQPQLASQRRRGPARGCRDPRTASGVPTRGHCPGARSVLPEPSSPGRNRGREPQPPPGTPAPERKRPGDPRQGSPPAERRRGVADPHALRHRERGSRDRGGLSRTREIDQANRGHCRPDLGRHRPGHAYPDALGREGRDAIQAFPPAGAGGAGYFVGVVAGTWSGLGGTAQPHTPVLASGGRITPVPIQFRTAASGEAVWNHLRPSR